jgi:uncharacterized protein (DUF1330 family)
MPSAYIIVDMKISDPDRYAQYMAAAPALVHAAGGEYLVRGGHVRMALLRFPGLEAAQAFYDSQSYRQVRTKREGATEFFDMVVVEGVAEPV